MKKLTLIKTHGGKNKCVEWILNLFPPNYDKLTYYEPFIGGGSILLNKRKSEVEIASDIDPNTFWVWYFLKNNSNKFISDVGSIDYTRENFETYRDFSPINFYSISIKEFVLRNMSRGGIKKDFAWSDRLRGGKPGDLNAWENKIKNLGKIAERIRDVHLYNKSVFDMWQEADLIYLDPPYLQETRKSKKIYDHEFSRADHELLLDMCLESNSKILLSGYGSSLYSDRLRSWNVFTKTLPNHSGQNKKKNDRTECIWRNF